MSLECAELEIRLPAERCVSGRVQPVGSALSQIRIDAAYHARTSTDASGRFVLRGLGNARYSTHVVAPVWFVPIEEFLEPRRGTEIEVRRASTTEDGFGVFKRLDPSGTYGIQVFPPRDRAELGFHQVPDWKPADSTIRLDTPSLVRGVVRYRSGEPARFAGVWWWSEEHRTWWSRQADREGRFLVEPTGVGGSSVRLRAGDDDGEPDENGIEEVEVVVGSTDVVLYMDRGVSLEVEVPNWPGEAYGSARLRAEGGLDLTRTSRGSVCFRKIRFDHLRADETYSLSIVGVGDGLAAEREGLRPKDSPIEVELALGKTIRGRISLPEGADRAHLTADQGRHDVRGSVTANGVFEVRGLTSGPWRLEAAVRAGGTWYHGEAEALAGETVDVTLRPCGR